MDGAHRLQIIRRMQKMRFTTTQAAELGAVSTTSLANYLNQRGRLVGEADLAEKLRRLEKFHDVILPLRLPSETLPLKELAVTEVTPEEVAAFIGRLFPWHRPE